MTSRLAQRKIRVVTEMDKIEESIGGIENNYAIYVMEP